ncbi:two-component system response regulator [Candidatus Tenderia electrophaga]|jgi:two-component system response regulator RegA|uniref:Two-component system response regulator n=1 Tax=Candidatus Tenderia electrophaga TaxID=1748243 RepID=A0A0S2TBC2_9GAMM|nr:two-component system response regulator [Candidatus Tenderia electrophaga]
MNDAADKPRLLLADDDEVFAAVLARALARRGYDVELAQDVQTGLRLAQQWLPDYAVIDLNMPDGSGLTLVKQICAQDGEPRVVVLTGYASIATAVEAIKLGAIHYLAKPADADDIVAALHKDTGDTEVAVTESPMSVRRLEWEHIQKVLAEVEGNVSEAARRLGMHRRTLQRKLQKRPVKQ